MILNAETATVPIDSVRPHPRNVNRGDMAAITESIAHNGFYGSLVVQRSTGHILAGTHRWMAAHEGGYAEVPVTYLDVDDATALRIMLADNRTSRLGADDPGGLAALLQEIKADAGTLLGTAFTDAALEALLADLAPKPEPGADPGPDIDHAEELRAKWGTKVGQVWTIPSATAPGQVHRLTCGDCTAAESWDRLRISGPAMVFTSPPYGMGDSAQLRDHYEPGAPVRESLYQTHADDPAAWLALMRAWSSVALPRVGVVVVNVQLLANNKRALIEWLHEFRTHLVDVAVWDKMGGAPQMHAGVMTNAYEWVVVLSPLPEASRVMPLASWHGTVQNIVRVNPRGSNEFAELHRAVMPPEVAEWALALCDGAAAVVDPFGGTGTTMVAAERAARVGYAIEIDPSYVAVTLERLEGMGLTPARAGRRA